MPSYKAPLRDTQFILNEVINIDRYASLPGFSDATPDLVSAILEEGAKFVEEVTQPLNLSGDEQGCVRHPDGSVTTPTGFKAAYDQLVEAGWGGLAADPAYGGQGLPHVIANAFEEFMISANMAFTMYIGLTQGAIAAITAVGSEDQKSTFIPRMVAGSWSGTMNLTEPHCGTDLGLLRTRAEPHADGSFRITGTKIFISSGEHDLTENIIHLVLAKMPDSPDTVRGISLFIVPKFLVNADGSLGERNTVSCGSLEEKMGIHGNSTCVMNYDGATGYLIGERDKGMRAMFVMMNAARLGVGLQGLAQSEVSYQNAVAYAQDRLQGRSLTGPKNKAGQADPIIVHPDVRRMLMNAKAFNEGARALALWGALQVDLTHMAATEEERQEADDLIGLLTPVIKGYFTDKGYENATNAQQCLGGHGYIREWGLEQFVRDARIAMIYEGTNGIQALDLVGRKLASNGGRALRTYVGKIKSYIDTHRDTQGMGEFVQPLEAALDDLQKSTSWLMANAMTNADNAGAASMPYLYLMGLVSLGFMWAQIAEAALHGLAGGATDTNFYSNKLRTGRYFFSHMLPETAIHRIRIQAGSKTLMEMDAQAF
ncbi:MAG: acyl-CoA dehydrogenase C-terminal domain-containing protein [Proteobacteria bacterium]|nr:acyl-CoA dehydrogenase C-terminal domain-containing protein [Pseudomonadota bacterium]